MGSKASRSSRGRQRKPEGLARVGRTPQGSPVTLLENLAQILNACAELNVKLKHGVIITDAGYVLPIGDKWVARTLTYTPFSDISDED